MAYKKMSVTGGIFGAKSKSGHGVDELKSALQKFARRGMTKEMIQVAYELDKFRVYHPSPQQKAIRTNMINRIKIILFEDVSFAEVGIFKRCIQLIKEWEENRDDDDSFNIIAHLCTLISSAKKLRQPSYIRNKFKDGVGMQTEETFMSAINSAQYTDGLALFFQSQCTVLKLLGGRSELEKFCIKEYKRVSREFDKCVFLIVPWLWIMFKDRLRTDEPMINVFDWKELRMDHDENLTLPEYIYDQHTKRGKRMGRGHDHFRKVASVAMNVDDEFLDENLSQNYHNSSSQNATCTSIKKVRFDDTDLT